MVTDQQVRRLFMLIQQEGRKTVAASKAGMDPKTALKYRKNGKLPSQVKQDHTWRTRPDPFSEDWEEIKRLVKTNSGLEAKTIFDYLQREHPGRYQEGQLRTLQRRIKQWRSCEGPGKEVYFPQKHYPGALCASDFTHMNSLEVMIQGEIFDHLAYHFVLTYSNWESVSVCFSESFESLSAGIQTALWDLGGVPLSHRSDRMSAAVNKDCHPEKFTRRYQGLLNHYGLQAERTNAGAGNENGDVEQSHHRFKRALEQALIMRGNRNFKDQSSYEIFLRGVVNQKNAGRRKRLEEELDALRRLPSRRLEDKTVIPQRVSPSSTIRVLKNVYSVHSRLIGERVEARLYIDHLEVWYAQRMVDRLPRLRGRSKHRIHYRHIIDWLVRKPGAFANYRYKADMFPSSYFRMAYDSLKQQCPLRADKLYLQILKIAAHTSETRTQEVLQGLLSQHMLIDPEVIQKRVEEQFIPKSKTEVFISDINLSVYDVFLDRSQEVVAHG